MITNSKQSWQIGNTVKIGFMSLLIEGIEARKDYMPDVYIMYDPKTNRRYEFIPHFGLTRI